MAGAGSTSQADLASQITPLVLTWNEAPNIARCLERLGWAPRVVVLDSGSTDDTLAIVRRFPNADIHVRPFDDYGAQRNHGLSLIRSPWVLSLDADYLVPPDFLEAVAAAGIADGVDAVQAGFRYCIYGRPLRASLYPPRPVLFRRERCRYEADGHSERLVISGRAVSIAPRIDHDDRKPLDRWFASQIGYARLEAGKLATRASADLNWEDRLRRTMVLGPVGAFVKTAIVKGCLLDGWPGWYYTLQRTVAETMVAIALIDRKFR